jgi:hypothetical protein
LVGKLEIDQNLALVFIKYVNILSLILDVACCIEVYMSGITDWDDIKKKEARGIDDYDLGEVHDLDAEVVVTKRGVVDKTSFTCLRLKLYDMMAIK